MSHKRAARAPRSSRSPQPPKRRRKSRSRPTPKWLLQPQTDLDEIARRRCLLVLTVLSGAQPVSEAIAEASISRGTYYKLESQALQAMLAALQPGAEAGSGTAGPAARIAQLEARVRHLEQDKRRAERLLFLTRQVVKPGTLKAAPGRPRKTRRPSSSTRPGKRLSPTSKTTPTPAPERTSPSPSTPTPSGAAAPSSGSES